MQPRFGIVTRVIAAVFALAGIGAAIAMLGVGDASDRLILLLLAVGFLVLALGLWSESVWAWWAGAAVVVLTVLLSRVLDTREARASSGWPPWLGSPSLGSKGGETE